MIYILAITSFARADTITFIGTDIPLRGCTIQGIQGGQVSFVDSSRQRQRRPLDEIEALGFDGLPELDQAEAAIAQQDFDTGLWSLLRALLKSQTDLQRQWVHARLSHVHDLRREYVQAAGHAAEVFMLNEDVSWKSLRPVSPVNTPSYAAAHEALASLQAAQKKVKSSELQRDLETMLRNVKPVHDKLAAGYSGPAIDPATTISGFAKADVLANQKMPAPGAATAGTTAQSKPGESAAAPVPLPSVTAAPPADAAASADPRSPAGIDHLLAASKWNDALAICQELEKNPGERDLARFLYQYGKALSEAGRKRDAAIMFTRCAILYPDSNDAGVALVETAVIERDEFKNAEAGRRLLQKVIADAESSGQQSTLMLARELLAKWPKN